MLQVLQDLPRSAIVVPAPARAPAIKPLPLEPSEPDLNETSLDILAELADLAYRMGDRPLAEQCIRRFYAQHDREQQPKALKGRGSAPPRRPAGRARSELA